MDCMNPQMLLKDRLALVTGAARGAGAAIAKGFAQQGARLVLADVDETGLALTQRDILQAGGEAHVLTLDVAESAACAQVASALRAIGDLSILVNNAGVRPRHDFDSASRDAHWQRALAVNVDGIRNLTLALLDPLTRTRGSVINITSITAYRASVRSMAYSTSKAAAQMLSQVLAVDLAPAGIRVNAIAPGVLETDMTRGSLTDPERRRQLLDRIPMQRFGTPDELVGPAVFLASAMSTYITGAVVCVDGGYLAT